MTLRSAAMMALLLTATALPSLADETEQETTTDGWSVSSDVDLTLTQNSYSDNWDGGETGSLSWALNSNSLAENQLSESMHSKNTLKLAFGQTHSQDKESKRWLTPSTTTDLVDFESVLRFTYGWPVDPFVSARVESRFLDTRDAEKTRNFNPTTFTEGAGIARVLIKNEEENREWVMRLGGAVRQHLDRDVLTEDAVTRETVSTSDAGLEFVSEFRSPLLEGAVTFTSDLKVFQALYYSESDALTVDGADDWKAPDVNWENQFSASITELIKVNLYVQTLYDKEVDSSIRVKETLSLGFTLKLL
jgi:hypothetical protein